ncbi:MULTISPECIES: carbohydrate ABC transporter permease [Streptomyces]|uniref:Carbohydrate ABC transporter permease n=1 Tax=Streptomyces thermoviolaceus subsp. thermoviolaceus TaxID=66860 RepID=A0ABX0YWG2_STRTL|nr:MULTISPECIES: carbohydrate ABC transporter permease [Streptomyces]WTD46092.1 carbohydrate ABC transporter permease [Streptomyces thermoviolaceus]NJP16659.1 carbohydrate ABC transporter permease [Streptomyces thermoviolaceus subsp. thermoviolaceus]RSS06828.1 carbohydrate ABC transporter permease [Streptomyces sp. WAC00469]GGV80811.1 sugar ABC transporter permease [Streptomyces thermoviolaceus subsp. apingens]GHA74412.1 sugar ABC transporter permease [Streptomyces thermoviolaceus subsp. therm
MTTITQPRPATAKNAPPTHGATLFNRLCAVCLTLFALIWLVPFFWAIATSLRSDASITQKPTSPFAGGWSLHAYSYAWDTYPIGTWYLNSLVISVLAVIFTVAFCSMAGFALAFLRFRGRNVVLALVAAGLMLPSEALVLPQFIEYRSLHLLGTFWALVLPSIAAPISVFVFRSFFAGIPVALIEAARIDGAGWWRIYARVCMPLCRPALSTVAILTFITTWNSFLWPLLVLSQTKSQTVPVGLASLLSNTNIQYAEVMASSVLGFLPLIAVFLIFQRQIVEGVTTTGIK